MSTVRGERDLEARERRRGANGAWTEVVASALLLVVAAVAYPSVLFLCCVGYIAGHQVETEAMTPSAVAVLAALSVAGVPGLAMAASGLAGLASLTTTTAHAWRYVRAHEVRPCPGMQRALAEARRQRVIAIDVAEHVAFTVGLLRPTVVLSKGLYDGLSAVQFRSVLAHELSHARRRDPLRLLLVRVAADHLWPVPGVEAFRERVECTSELAADRHAAQRYGAQALAGALLAFEPVGAVDAVARFKGPAHLEARVVQLENGCLPTPRSDSWEVTTRVVTSAAVVVAAFAAVHVLVVLVCTGCLLGVPAGL